MPETKPYPIEQAEYGTYDWLMRELGGHVDYGYDSAVWDHTQRGRLDSIVQSGYQRLCFSTPLFEMRPTDVESVEGEGRKPELVKHEIRRQPHQWTFLSPIANLEIVIDKDVYDLPADFAGPIGDFNSGSARIPIVSEEQLRAIVTSTGVSGTPEYAAIRTRAGQNGRYEVLFYPKPDAALTFTYRYSVRPSPLGESNQMPVCGAQHAEALLASCMVVAAERGLGNLQLALSAFADRLSASVHLDRQTGRVTESTTWDTTITGNAGEGAHSLRSMVGEHLGYGQNENAWTKGQLEKVKEAVRQGKRMFRVPMVLEGEIEVHEWSFLRPTVSLQLTSGQSEYDLPKDFAGLDSPISYQASGSVIYPDIDIVGEHLLRKRLQINSSAGRPTVGAIRIKDNPNNLKDTSNNAYVQYELMVWPVPDDAYDLWMKYKVVADHDDVLLGGPDHYQTILEACKFCADMMNGQRTSPHERIFKERLRASIAYDRQLHAPWSQGYNRDRRSSMRSGGYFNWHMYSDNTVTYGKYFVDCDLLLFETQFGALLLEQDGYLCLETL